jgi:hypothetical protein
VIEHNAVTDPSRDPQPAGRQDPPSISEVVDLVKTYARQETIGPLRGAGTWLAKGMAGALLVGLGSVIFLLGVLRLVQWEVDRLARGSLSWVAYAVALVVAGILIALSLRLIKRDTLHTKARTHTKDGK